MRLGILHLVTGLAVGGAENVIYNLSTNLNKKKFKVYVRSLSKDKDELLEKFKKSIDTDILDVSKKPLGFIYSINRINNFIKTNNIKIIHAHMFHSVIVASVLKLINPKLKIVFTYHTSRTNRYFREIALLLLKPIRNIDIIFSENSKEYFYKNNYKVIPNGVDVSLYQAVENKYEKFTFITIGRLEYMKNHDILIDICKKLENLDFQILIVGEGSLEEKLKDKVVKNELTSKIKFLGRRYDIPKLLAKSHVFLLPSIIEGMPIVLLEAGASNLPIISTKVGSIPLVLGNDNSFMSDIEDFHIEMMKVMDNYNFALKKAKLLKEKIYNEFSMKVMINNHEKIYSELFIKER